MQQMLMRSWKEADIGIDRNIGRNKQAGTRLLYSNDVLLFIASWIFNSRLSTLSESAQEKFIEFVITENAKEIDLINEVRTPAEKMVVLLVDKFIESRESQGIKVSPNITSFAKKNKVVLDERPKNLTPEGAGRQGAFNEAKRQSGIPTSQQPSKVYPNIDRRDKPQPGRIYEFEVPTPYEGEKKTIIIRDDAKGHFFGENDPQNRGPHFNDPKGGIMITNKYILRKAMDISQDNEIAQFEKKYFKPRYHVSAISVEGLGINIEDKVELFCDVLDALFYCKKYINFLLCIPEASDNKIINYIGGWGVLSRNGVLLERIANKKEHKIKKNGKLFFFL